MKPFLPENVPGVGGGAAPPRHGPRRSGGKAPGFGEALRVALEAGATERGRASSGATRRLATASQGSAPAAEGAASEAEGSRTPPRGVAGQRAPWGALVRDARGAGPHLDAPGEDAAGARAGAGRRSLAKATERGLEGVTGSAPDASQAAGRQVRTSRQLARGQTGAPERETTGEAASPGAAEAEPGAPQRRRADVAHRARGAGSAAEPFDAVREAAAGVAAAVASSHGAAAAHGATGGGSGASRAVTAALADAHARIASALATLSPRAPTTALAAATKAAAAVEGHERDHAKGKEREPSRAADAPAAATRQDLPAPAAPRQETLAAARHGDALATPATDPALPAASPGQDVQGAVLRQAAHLKLDAGDLGAVELHLRLRGDALHLRVDGEGARAVEARVGELSTALAGEGLKLALDPPAQDAPGARTGGEGGRQGEERRQAWNEAADQRDRPPATPSPSPRRTTRTAPRDGVHVKA